MSNFFTINAKSLKSKHRVTQIPVVYNLSCVQDLLYADNSDVVCTNETWLNSDFDNQELLPTGYTIYRTDRLNQNGGGVLIAIKTDSFTSVREYLVDSDELLDLEIVLRLPPTVRKKYFSVPVIDHQMLI